MVQPLPDLGEVKVVLEDLDFLTKTWDHNVDESSLRITSPILYRLIVEGHLGRVASSLGIELRIMAMAEAQEMSRKNTKAIRFWLAGGGLSGNVKVWDVQVFDRSLSAEEIADINRRSLPHRGKKKPEKLGRYGKLPAFVLDGAIINNEEVIKYVTDKLGGRHYSAERGAAPLQA